MKIERFIIDQLRNFIDNELVFPNYHSIEISKEEDPEPIEQESSVCSCSDNFGQTKSNLESSDENSTRFFSVRKREKYAETQCSSIHLE